MQRAVSVHDRPSAAPLSDPEAVPALQIEAVEKRFSGPAVVSDCSLSVADGEILALLGPSGCGKTTLLNMIAGFETPDRGDVRLSGVSQRDMPPNRRPVGIVFQNYALFPHMTVAQNIGYGLVIARAERAAIDARVSEVAALLKIEPFLARYPSELSGGQKQRVAIARALARRPKILLLDEAMSALDKTLREAVQVELAMLLRRLKMTAVLVTHDQREAFTIGDRVAVMNEGRVAQIGTTRDLFERPASRFVVEFLGAVNKLPASAAYDGGVMRVNIGDAMRFTVAHQRPAEPAASLDAYLPYAAIRLSPRPTPVHALSPAVVELVTHLGTECRVFLTFQSRQILCDVPAASAAAIPPFGSRVFLDFDPEELRFFA